MRARVLFALVTTLVLGASLAAADPKPRNPIVLAAHVTSATYGRVPGKLFHHGVRVTDYDQRKIGNCWYVAGAAAVAHRNPEIVKQAFTRNPGGTVSVRLFQRRWWWPWSFKEVTVDVTPEVPLDGGRIIYGAGHNTRHGEHWPSLLEKAAAKLRGGYFKLVGGSPAEAMEMLTGKRAKSVVVTPERADKVYETIKQASREGRPLASTTYSKSAFARRVVALAATSPDHPFLQALRKATGGDLLEGSGVWANHSYTILGVSEKDGQRRIVVRNPWGHSGPPRTGFGTGPADHGGDGIFELPVDMFAQIFDGVQIGGSKALPKK